MKRGKLEGAMKPYYETELGRLWIGDCNEGLKNIKNVDFSFADPPYGINKAEWDKDYPTTGFEKKLLQISRNGVAITPGQQNIGICINNLGGQYKGILAARNLNGMTFSKIGFENWIPTVLGGDIKRGQNYFEFSVKGTKPEHPSPKPLAYMMKIIQRFTIENDIILDPFMGSATTAIACECLNRRWIGIEISEAYAEIAAKRIENERKQMRMF